MGSAGRWGEIGVQAETTSWWESGVCRWLEGGETGSTGETGGASRVHRKGWEGSESIWDLHGRLGGLESEVELVGFGGQVGLWGRSGELREQVQFPPVEMLMLVHSLR